jgi:hypothetical protein
MENEVQDVFPLDLVNFRDTSSAIPQKISDA